MSKRRLYLIQRLEALRDKNIEWYEGHPQLLEDLNKRIAYLKLNVELDSLEREEL